MPELPEVETTTQGLKKTIVGLTIKNVWTDLATKDKRKVDSVANTKYFKSFKRQILNRKIVSIERRAKNILINLENKKTILIHLKMTGHLLYGKYKFNPSPTLPLSRGGRRVGSWLPAKKGPLHDPYNRFVHVVFTLLNPRQSGASNTHLAFSDARKFGKVVLLDTKTAHESKHLNNIGPEPLEPEFKIGNLKQRLNRWGNKKIKTALMDQSIIAGIGNIYSDEILWRAGVHPERKVSKVKTEGKNSEMKLIFRAIKEVLAKGIDFGGDSMSDYRNVEGLPGKFQLHHEAYRRTKEKCRKPGCKGVILRKVVTGRSAHFCSIHQR